MSALSSNVKITLPPVPIPFSGTTAWAALTPLVNTINNNFNVIANGAGFIPGTVRLVNGRPVNLSTGDLTILLSDVPGSTSNAYVNSTFATISALTGLVANVNSGFTAANAAIQTLRNTVNSLPSGNVSGNTAQVSSWIQSNIAAVTAAWSANAAAQQTSINSTTNNLNSFATYSNVQIGSVYTSLDSVNTSVGQLVSNVSALFANAATQSTQIAAVAGNLTAYQTAANSTLSATVSNVSTLQSQTTNLANTQNSVNTTLASLSTEISNLTGQLSVTNSNLSANVTAFAANIATLFSNAATQATAIASINSNVALLANNNNRTIHVSNQAPGPTDGNVGDIWYQTI